VSLIVGFFGVISKLALEKGESLLKREIAPFKGNPPANLFFGTLQMGCLSLTLKKKQNHPLQDLFMTLHKLSSDTFSVSSPQLVTSNAERYQKDKILAQLDCTRYRCITFNKKRVEEDNVGTVLFNTLTTGPYSLDDERAAKVLCQLEIQAFADPVIDLSQAVARLGLDLELRPGSRTVDIDLSIKEGYCCASLNKLMDLNGNNSVLATIEIEVNLGVPLDPQQPEKGSYSWKISEIKDSIRAR
ncbi:MAG: hypothetical protein HRU43_05725, partial [Simkaniaceae bacterium]|nr:hypothetical protein [Simkaniaceae bacterium]